jgi:uncharacterized protein (TIGR03083 family)
LSGVQLNPRYGRPPALVIDTSLTDVAAPLTRQRRRLAELLSDLTDDQWAAPSRCEGWSTQDVVAHLVVTNQFWDFSMKAGLAGEPTRVLATFDPVASPAQMVEQVRSRTPAETLAQFVESNDAFLGTVATIADDQWATVAEAPPGHVALRAVALHALWDAWVHERDVALPLGIEAAEEPDEVAGSLQYAAALSPTFLATNGSVRTGHLSVRATDPDVSFVVAAGPTVTVSDGTLPSDGALVLAGPAVALTEALSLRRPLEQPVATSDRWLLEGLAEVFDVAR